MKKFISLVLALAVSFTMVFGSTFTAAAATTADSQFVKIAKEIHAKGTTEEGSDLLWVKNITEAGEESMKFMIGADKDGSTLVSKLSYLTATGDLDIEMVMNASQPDKAIISYFCDTEQGTSDLFTEVKPSAYVDEDGFEWKINGIPKDSDPEMAKFGADIMTSLTLSIWSDMINKNTSYSGIYDLGWKKFCGGHHDYDKEDILKVIKKPTTKATGKQKVRCIDCGKVYTSTIPKVPTKPTITKVSKGTKSFTVKWKKKSSVTGYQVRYSTSKSMKNAKKVTVAKKSATAKTVKKLKKGKKYYVQVRAYKKHHGVNYYSSWSKKKYVRTK